jgi:hypothetical protein
METLETESMVSLKTAGKFRENGTQLVDLGYHASRVFIDSKGVSKERREEAVAI